MRASGVSALLVGDGLNFHKACKIGRDGMKYSAKSWQKVSPLRKIVPRLAPDCVHHEISNFQCWFTSYLRHEGAFGGNVL